MKKIANLMAAAAFVLGLAGVQLYAQRLRADLQGGELTSVLVVTEDLPAGTELEAAHVASIEIPADYLDARRVRSAEQKSLLGAELVGALRAGDPIFWSDVSQGAARRDLAELVAPGQRAYQVEADANPLGTLLHAGDRVDVLLERGGTTALLLERILVLAVGGRLQNEGESTPSGRSRGVTLSVTVEQGAELLAAEARGDLRLLLRNPKDEEARVKAATDAPNARRADTARSVTKKKEIDHVR